MDLNVQLVLKRVPRVPAADLLSVSVQTMMVGSTFLQCLKVCCVQELTSELLASVIR